MYADRRPGQVGRIRQGDDSLSKAGINKGDLIIIDLTKQPEQDKLCAAFTAYGELVVRFFHQEESGNVRLTTWPGAKVVQAFAPAAVVILGCVREIMTATIVS
jgi:SOS-response transcriptional repressor LexA